MNFFIKKRTMKPMSLPPNKKKIDFNLLLQLAISGVLLLTLTYYAYMPLPDIINGFTLFLFVILACQLVIILLFEKKYRNPVVLVLVFTLCFFYLPRVFLFSVVENDFILNRLMVVGSFEVNQTLQFIIISNVFLVLGIFSTNLLSSKKVTDFYAPDCRVITRCLLFYILTLAFFVIDPDRGWFLMEIARYIFSPVNALLVNFAALICFAGREKPVFSYSVLLILTLGFLLVLAMGGSRQSLLVGILLFLFCRFGLGSYKFSIKTLLVGTLAICVLVISYQLISELRVAIWGNDLSGVASLVFSINYFLDLHSNGSLVDFGSLFDQVIKVFERISFLDFNIYMIANAEENRVFINFENVLKSLVDSFSPGFEVFDVAKLSNGLSGVYENNPEKFKRINAESYRSDQFGLYGDFYVIFYGLLSLPFFYIFGFCFALIFERAQRIKNLLTRVCFSALTLKIFFDGFNSFGLDWTFIYLCYDTISLVVALIFILGFSRRRFSFI